MMSSICPMYPLNCTIGQKIMTETPPLLSQTQADEQIKDRNVSTKAQILQTLT